MRESEFCAVSPSLEEAADRCRNKLNLHWHSLTYNECIHSNSMRPRRLAAHESTSPTPLEVVDLMDIDVSSEASSQGIIILSQLESSMPQIIEPPDERIDSGPPFVLQVDQWFLDDNLPVADYTDPFYSRASDAPRKTIGGQKQKIPSVINVNTLPVFASPFQAKDRSRVNDAVQITISPASTLRFHYITPAELPPTVAELVSEISIVKQFFPQDTRLHRRSPARHRETHMASSSPRIAVETPHPPLMARPFAEWRCTAILAENYSLTRPLMRFSVCFTVTGSMVSKKVPRNYRSTAASLYTDSLSCPRHSRLPTVSLLS